MFGRTMVSFPSATSASMYVEAGSESVTPFNMCCVLMRCTQSVLGLRQVDPVVDADGLGPIVNEHGLDRQAGSRSLLHDVCQIVFAFLWILLDAVQRIPNPLGSEAVRAHVQLMDLQLLGTGNVFFDDGRHLTALACARSAQTPVDHPRSP